MPKIDKLHSFHNWSWRDKYSSPCSTKKSTMKTINLRNYYALCVSFISCACVIILLQLGFGPRNFISSSSRQNDCLFEESSRFSFDLKFVEENLNSLNQTNPHLIHYTRIKYLYPPSELSYNLKENDPEKMKTPLAKWVLKFFGDKRDGIFVEAGANDGEANSNTLYLEKELGWTGILIECNPQLIPFMLTKHRKSWVGDVCLAPNLTPGTFNMSVPVGYEVAGTIGKPMDHDKNKTTSNFEVQAVPLYTILAAIGWKEIDYFSFDIEGLELGLLRNFPFDKVTFKVITVEVQYYSDKEKEEMTKLLDHNGYILVEKIHIDHYYIHRSVKHLLPK